MKKIISAALLLIFCFSLVPAASAAESNVVVTLRGGSASAGESIQVELFLTASVPVNSIAVSGIEYDPDVLTFTGFSDYEHLDTVTALPPTFDKDKGVAIIGLRQAQVFDGKICSLNFEVSEEAPAGAVSVSATALTKNSADTVSSSVIPAVITVVGSTPAAHTIAVGDVEHGAVSVDKSMATIGEMVTVTATPETGYVLKSIYVDGEAIVGNTFAVTGDHVVTAVFEHERDVFTRRSLAVWLAQRIFDPEMQPTGEEYTFTDITPTDPDYREILLCCEAGLLAGSDGKFMPDGTLTRAQLATIFVKLHLGYEINANSFKGMTWFTDTSLFEGGWAEAYITLAVALGTMSGYSDGTFRPGDLAAEEDIIESALYRTVLDYGSCGTSLIWVVYDNGELVISGNGAMSDGAPWDGVKDRIQKVTIEDGVTNIGSDTFDECSNLTKLNISNSVTAIGDGAFWGCAGLTEVDIPNSVLTIGFSAFGGCGITEVVIPDSVVSIGGRAFQMCDNLTTVTIGAGVTEIGYRPFFLSLELTNIFVSEDNVTFCDVDGVVFSKDMNQLVLCPGGKSGVYTIPDGVQVIGDRAFNFSCLDKVIVPDSVEIIDEYAFEDAGLSTIVIGRNVKTIEDGAFFNAISLSRVEFMGNAPETVGEDIFWDDFRETVYYHEGTTGWTNSEYYDAETGTWCGVPLVMIPSSYEGIVAYGYCGGEGDGTNLKWTLYEDGELVIEGSGAMVEPSSHKMPWYGQKDKIKAVTIRSGVTSIGLSAFDGYNTITSVVIPDTVTVIGSRAFFGCELLNDVVLPKELVEIGEVAFFGCRALENITIPSKVERIGNGAFSSCISLQTISVETGNAAYCVEDGVLYTKDMKQLIAYPAGIPARDYVIPLGVTHISDYAFQESKITAVTIPDSVVSIGSWAFITCNSITEITVPANVSVLGDGAFANCWRLTNIFVAEENETFCSENGVLYSKDMKTILCCPRGQQSGCFVIPDSVTRIGNQAFFYGRSLTEVVIPDGVTHIGENAFQGTSLSEVRLPNQLVLIGKQAFYDCDSLNRIIIPAMVEEVEYLAFSECAGLEEVEFLGNAPKNPSETQSSWPNIFGGSNEQLTVYYHEEAGGWKGHAEKGTWCGRPLVMIPKTQEPSTLGYFSLDVIKTIVVDGEEVQICRWIWTPFKA